MHRVNRTVSFDDEDDLSTSEKTSELVCAGSGNPWMCKVTRNVSFGDDVENDQKVVNASGDNHVAIKNDRNMDYDKGNRKSSEVDISGNNHITLKNERKMESNTGTYMDMDLEYARERTTEILQMKENLGDVK
jgi:hypothetical protein